LVTVATVRSDRSAPFRERGAGSGGGRRGLVEELLQQGGERRLPTPALTSAAGKAARPASAMARSPGSMSGRATNQPHQRRGATVLAFGGDDLGKAEHGVELHRHAAHRVGAQHRLVQIASCRASSPRLAATRTRWSSAVASTLRLAAARASSSACTPTCAAASRSPMKKHVIAS
jgi:hypothetical protein